MTSTYTLRVVKLILFVAVLLPITDLRARDIRHLRGVDTNYFYSPLGPWDDEVWRMTKDLRIELIRFPGGTLANLYDWESGKIVEPRGSRIPRAIKFSDFMVRARKESLKIIYVINMFDSVEKTVRLVKSINEKEYPVIALELGNELYSREFSERIGGARGYWKKSFEVAKALRSIGNKLPLGIVVSPECIPTRQKKTWFEEWNKTLADLDLSMFQAVILHYYRGIKSYRVAPGGIHSCADRIERQFPNKKIWLTEWNLGGGRNSPRHTMMHALFVARLYIAILKERRITIANYHALDTMPWGLFVPNPTQFNMPHDLSKSVAPKSVPVIKRIPYFALRSLYQILADNNDNIGKIKHLQLTDYGPLPVDILVLGKLDSDSDYVIIINPNDKTIPLSTLNKYLGESNLNAVVLTSEPDSKNELSESIVPKKISVKTIERVSMSVFEVPSTVNR